MKKINLLISTFATLTAASTILPMVTSCSRFFFTAISQDMLNIRGAVLYGLKDKVDISNCDTLIIPDGVKFIEENAFANVFSIGTKGSKVRTIVFPSSLTEVRKNAFANCNAIRILNFNSWSVNQIYYSSFAQVDTNLENGAFSGCFPGGIILFNDDISSESKTELTKRLAYSGVWPSWSLDESYGKIEQDKAYSEQTVLFGKTNYLFRLTEKLAENTYLLATITQNTGTDGVEVINTKMLVDEIDENNIVKLPVTLINHSNAGDYATFNVTFSAVKFSGEFGSYEPIWKQTLNGFKLTNSTNLVTSLKLECDKVEIKVDDTTKIIATALPESATDKSVTFSSDNKAVADVDASGVVTAKAVGVANITVKANGAVNVTNTIKITVKAKE